MVEFEGLLPDNFDEFRSPAFWDGFFAKRKQNPFEWYGTYKQLRPLLRQACTLDSNTRVLVPGCGNSDLSADLCASELVYSSPRTPVIQTLLPPRYDDGVVNITNIDFSRPVIKEMMVKNVRHRPRMKWLVGDMTQMKFEDSSFDVVVDKGGLDALMGEDSAGADTAGSGLLAEVSRLLAPGGAYLCVTLAQAHVLRRLLRHFGQDLWHMNVWPVPPSPDMATSPLQPVLFAAIRTTEGTGSLQLHLAVAKAAVNAAQLADICQIVEAEQRRRASQAPSFDGLVPGRRVEVPLGSAKGATARFHAVVLDTAGPVVASAGRECCVFIIPQGRDAEWLFGSEVGQWEVAQMCSARRVILVSLARGHAFGTSAAVQAELSPLVRDLAPLKVRGQEGKVEILTTDEGVGERRVLEEASSSLSGRIVVEDVALADGDGAARLLRRLVFVTARSLIQSEAFLVSSPDGTQTKARRKKSSGGGKLAAAGKLTVDHSRLAMEYHNAIVAGLALAREQSAGGRATALVVGLGGGGLAVWLHAALGLDVKVVELDATVLGLAQRHFGFQHQPGLEAIVADGLAAVSEAAATEPGALNFLVVDAGSGEAELAMSCPPPPFLEPKFLSNAKKALRPGALLAINCVSRAEAPYRRAIAAVQAAGFAEVWEADVEEDVNRVLFALTEGSGETSISLQQQSARLAALARASWPPAAGNSASSGNSGRAGTEVRASSATGSSEDPAAVRSVESAAGVQEVSGAGEFCASSAETARKEHILEVPKEVLAHMGSLKLLP